MNERNEHKECTFDAYCKRVLKNESVNAHLEIERQGQREVTFSELSKEEARQLQYIDVYAPERRVFPILGMEVEIADGALVRALSGLAADRRSIVLLAYLLDWNDAEIAARLGMNRSTVQYRRTSTLDQLRKLMEEYDHD